MSKKNLIDENSKRIERGGNCLNRSDPKESLRGTIRKQRG
jgi:hypothetical protein